MKVINKRISIEELKEMARRMFGDLVKAVVDVEREVMVVDGELHADEEALLLGGGSRQSEVWGINIYVEEEGEEWIEFDSMINVRPSSGNRGREVEDEKIRKRIIKVVNKLVER
jgi:hypothetical protein